MFDVRYNDPIWHFVFDLVLFCIICCKIIPNLTSLGVLVLVILLIREHQSLRSRDIIFFSTISFGFLRVSVLTWVWYLFRSLSLYLYVLDKFKHSSEIMQVIFLWDTVWIKIASWNKRCTYYFIFSQNNAISRKSVFDSKGGTVGWKTHKNLYTIINTRN